MFFGSVSYLCNIHRSLLGNRIVQRKVEAGAEKMIIRWCCLVIGMGLTIIAIDACNNDCNWWWIAALFGGGFLGYLV